MREKKRKGAGVRGQKKAAPVLPGAFHDIIRLKQSLLSLETLF